MMLNVPALRSEPCVEVVPICKNLAAMVEYAHGDELIIHENTGTTLASYFFMTLVGPPSSSRSTPRVIVVASLWAESKY